MKKLALTGIATLALAAAAFAQGLVAIDDSANANGVADVTAGSYYSGTFGMEVWELNAATSVPSGINGASTPTAIAAAYAALATDKFNKEVTFANQTMSMGTFALGTATLPDVTPAGSSVVLALAVWNNSGATWSTGTAMTGVHGGLLAFVNPTVAPTTSGPPPTPASLSGWTSGDLVMNAVTTVPEPGTLALAGLGLASLLIFRRRK